MIPFRFTFSHNGQQKVMVIVAVNEQEARQKFRAMYPHANTINVVRD